MNAEADFSQTAGAFPLVKTTPCQKSLVFTQTAVESNEDLHGYNYTDSPENCHTVRGRGNLGKTDNCPLN